MDTALLAKTAAAGVTAPLAIGPANALGAAPDGTEASEDALTQAQALAAEHQEEIEDLEKRLQATHAAPAQTR